LRSALKAVACYQRISLSSPFAPQESADGAQIQADENARCYVQFPRKVANRTQYENEARQNQYGPAAFARGPDDFHAEH
jgi:hypothetical protein